MAVYVALRKESVDRNNLTGGRSTCAAAVALRKESVDRNMGHPTPTSTTLMSLSARRAWIEIVYIYQLYYRQWSLSARRAWIEIAAMNPRKQRGHVALRKESVDRNITVSAVLLMYSVALRKESVDRNCWRCRNLLPSIPSLSARRAWIEIRRDIRPATGRPTSLSARRAWIEII